MSKPKELKQKKVRALDLDVTQPGSFTIPEGLIKKIHVNKHNIRRNHTHNENNPIYTCKTSWGNFKGHVVEIHGPADMRQDRKRLNCGAVAWVQTTAAVTVSWEAFED